MKKIIACPIWIISIGFLPYFSQAQSHQFSGWVGSFNTIKTSARTSIHSDIQLRTTDKLENTQTILLRAGLNVHLNKTLVVTGGYAYIRNRRTVSNVTGYTPEHRIWQQLVINHKIKRIVVAHRFRTEQRFLAKTTVVNNELNNDMSGYANRLRYFIRNVIPLKKEASFQKGVFASLQNEIFVNIGDATDVNGKFFDQNRFYIAAGYRLSAKSDLELGYMNQHIEGKNASTSNHIIQVAGYLRL